MPVAVVIPTGNSKTATDRSAEEAQILFPNMDDTGLDISDFCIVIVFNGIHHFVGTKKPQPTFKDGVTDVITHLQQARVICDNLRAEDQSVKGVVATTSKTAATIAYNLERLFKPPVTVPEEGAEAAASAEPPSKRQRHDSTDNEVIAWKTSLTRDGHTSMTTLHCHCGVRKATKEDLEDHKKRNHSSGYWKCGYTGCKTVCSGKNPEKSLRKHVRNQHLNEYLYWCKYCTTYGKDQRHLVINHMFTVHGMGQQLPCRHIGCNKLFPSLNSLKEHEQFCREGKKYTCDFCHRMYKRMKNMKSHIKNMHTTTGAGKLLCTACGRTYESKTSYTAHYTNNQCLKMIIPGMIQDYDDDPQDDLEGEAEEEQEQDTVQEGEATEFSDFQ